MNEWINKLTSFFGKSNSKAIPGSVNALNGITKVDYIYEWYQNALASQMTEFDRESRMWKMFRGIDNEQYDDDIITEMEDDGRNPFQGNFIRKKVDVIGGALLQKYYDFNYVSLDDGEADYTEFLEELMYSDKELEDWEISYDELVKNGLVHFGAEQLVISDEHDPLGRLKFEICEPGTIILDPDWLSYSAKKLKRLWKVGYLRADDIKRKFKKKTNDIDAAVKMLQLTAPDYDEKETGYGLNHYNKLERYNDTYRVIEFHHIEMESKTVEVVVSTGMVVPEGPDEYKREWAITNNIDLSDGVMEKTYDVPVYYVTTICPELSRNIVLEDKKSPIQIGRLPFFIWSCARINGKNSGVPDLLESFQTTYNHRQSQIDFLIGASANGGHFIDPDIVDNDADKMRELAQNWNKANFKMYTAPGRLASGRQHIQEIPRSRMDYAAVQELTRMMDDADRVSAAPANIEGRSEGSEENGILFARKESRAEMAFTFMIRSLRHYNNEKAEAWLNMARILYSGAMRYFATGSGKGVYVNQPQVSPSGEITINDISMIPRIKIIVSESPNSESAKQKDRSLNVEALRVIDANLNPLNRSLAVSRFMNTLEGSKEEKDMYKKAGQKEAMLANARIEAEMASLQFQTLQVQMQMQQMMNPQPQQQLPPEAGGGVSQEQGSDTQNAPGNPLASEQGNNLEAQTPPQ